jgi:hypothetical protein
VLSAAPPAFFHPVGRVMISFCHIVGLAQTLATLIWRRYQHCSDAIEWPWPGLNSVRWGVACRGHEVATFSSNKFNFPYAAHLSWLSVASLQSCGCAVPWWPLGPSKLLLLEHRHAGQTRCTSQVIAAALCVTCCPHIPPHTQRCHGKAERTQSACSNT